MSTNLKFESITPNFFLEICKESRGENHDNCLLMIRSQDFDLLTFGLKNLRIYNQRVSYELREHDSSKDM